MVSFLQIGRQYWMRTNAFLKDSYHLGRAVLQERNGQQQLLTDTWRNVVTTQARQSNQAAVTVLQIQQQIGLLRYHGMMEYLRQQRLRSSSSSSTSMTTRASSSTSSTTGVAKVAFMITSSMKTQLVDELGYDVEQIKEMTPTQASLILHHKVSPSAMEQELPILIQQYEEQQKAEQQKAAASESAVDEVVESTDTKPASSMETLDDQQQQQQQPHQEEPVLLESNNPSSEVSSLSLSETEALNDRRALFGNHVDDIAFGLDSEGTLTPTVWYEIIEIDTMRATAANDNEETLSQAMIVAMYRTKDEAQMALELKEAFAERQAKAKKMETPSLIYKIRKSYPVEKGNY